jgi:hypothetical protein
MRVARFWSRDQDEVVNRAGERIQVVSRGWSDESIEAARAKAREIARRVAQRIANNPTSRNQYPYGDRPIPEPVIREFGEAARAMVTRNVYGALVLNTDDLMFVDIDREDAEADVGGDLTAGLQEALSGIFSLFGKQAPAAQIPKAPATVLDSIRGVVEKRGLSARVYRTAAGHRVLVTDRRFRAGDSETEALLNEFGADGMYMRLCRTQESFRARLTPKPWRCGHRKPPVAFPFETGEAVAAFEEWEQEYERQCQPHATCRFVASLGNGAVVPGFEELIEYHDRETKALSGQPLA